MFWCTARFMLEFLVSPLRTDRAIKCRGGRESNGSARLWVAIALLVLTNIQCDHNVSCPHTLRMVGWHAGGQWCVWW